MGRALAGRRDVAGRRGCTPGHLEEDDLQRLGALTPAGDRHADMAFVNRDTPERP